MPTDAVMPAARQVELLHLDPQKMYEIVKAHP
jgi:hypothetical protein